MSVPSSKLATSAHSPASEFVPPPPPPEPKGEGGWGGGGEQPRLRNSDDWRESLSLFILCGEPVLTTSQKLCSLLIILFHLTIANSCNHQFCLYLCCSSCLFSLFSTYILHTSPYCIEGGGGKCVLMYTNKYSKNENNPVSRLT